VATLNSYTFNRKWTFRAGPHRHARLLKFIVVQMIGLGINLGVLALLVEYGGFEDHKLLAQLISNCFVVGSNFLGNKFWTFKD
jgi:putative flippase GtrA